MLTTKLLVRVLVAMGAVDILLQILSMKEESHRRDIDIERRMADLEAKATHLDNV